MPSIPNEYWHLTWSAADNYPHDEATQEEMLTLFLKANTTHGIVCREKGTNQRFHMHASFILSSPQRVDNLTKKVCTAMEVQRKGKCLLLTGTKGAGKKARLLEHACVYDMKDGNYVSWGFNTEELTAAFSKHKAMAVAMDEIIWCSPEKWWSLYRGYMLTWANAHVDPHRTETDVFDYMIRQGYTPKRAPAWLQVQIVVYLRMLKREPNTPRHIDWAQWVLTPSDKALLGKKW